MVVLAIIIFLVGTVVGLRLKVFMVVPITVVGWGLFVFGIQPHQGAAWVALGLAVVALAAQLGFLFGVFVRYATAAARIGRRNGQRRQSSSFRARPDHRQLDKAVRRA
jgi:hypothetical protein